MQDQQPIFRAIADPTRRAIIAMLSEREMTVSDITANFDMSRPAVTKHLGILRAGQLVDVKARGRARIHSLRPEALKTVSDWVATYSQLWDARLQTLKAVIEEENP